MPLLGFSSLNGVFGGVEEISLHGSEATPIEATHTAADPDDALAVWSLIVDDGTNGREKGFIMKAEFDFGDVAVFIKSFPTTDWVTPHDFQTTYFTRATLVAGVAPLSGFLDIWQSLVPDTPSPTGNRSWTWSQAIVGTKTGTIRIEIATDALGADIVATGYYKVTVTVT